MNAPVDVSFFHRDAKPLTSYKVKMLRADQTVMKLRLDPATGAVTRQEKD